MKERRVLGLDIGSRNLKVALLRRNGRDAALCGFSVKEFPVDIRDNSDARESFVVETVRDFLGQNGIKRIAAYCCLPTGAMGESTLLLPAMTGKELKQAVRMHVKKKLGDGAEPFSFDFRATRHGLPDRDGTTMVQVAVAPEEMLRALVRMGEAAGLEMRGIHVWGIAIENLLEAGRSTSGKCIAVLEIGAVRSSIGVFRDGHLHFAREIPTGGDAFTKALMEMPITAGAKELLGMSAAERMKRRHGILMDGNGEGLEKEEAAHFSAMLRPQVERLVLEVRRSVEYYQRSFDSGEVQELYLCGGGARLKNLALALSEQLRMHVRELPIFSVKLLSESVERQFEYEAPAMAVAIGAALDDGEKISLLPREVVTERKFAKARNWFQFLLIASLIWMFYARQQARKELPRLQTHISMGKEALSLMQDGLAKVEILNALRSELASLEAVLAERNTKCPDWVGVLKEIGNIIPGNIVLNGLASDSDSEEKGIVLRGKVLQGALMKNLEVSELVLRLEGSPFFKNVRLLPSKGGESDKTLRFEISCVLAY